MKLRYFMLPIIIISTMFLILSKEKNIVNVEILSDSKEVTYPFFSNEKIDNYIINYLNEYIENDEKVLIDYDYTVYNSLYYLTFYKYIFNQNMINSDVDSFLINNKDNSVNRIEDISYEYDFVLNKIIDKDAKLVALTFDDGPNYNTNKVLSVLEKYNVPATFFVLGSKIKGNEYILEKMLENGHEIGNHTFNHLLLTKYDESKIKEEIENTSNLIFEATNVYPKLLRPSYGSVSKKIKDISEYPIIIWDIDTLDWKYHNSKKIARRVVNKVKDGDIVLMHDVYSATANALYIIIPELKEKGYTFVTVSDLFYYKNISLKKGSVYGYAR